MFRCAPIVVLALASCTIDWDAVSQAGHELPSLSTGSTGSTSGGTPTTSVASSGTTGFETSTGVDETSSSETMGTTSEATAGDTTGELLPPVIVGFDVPDPVKIAGPAAFSVTTEHATTVRARLDGVELDPLTSEGDGVFAGSVPIYGTVDNGSHVLEVIAENEGPVNDARSVPFEVLTPAAGTIAWAEYGPDGSNTNRLALTPEGDVLEAGSLEVEGVSRPALRKRAASSGVLVWAEGTKVLDDREGSAVGVAVTPDGGMWTAMNVREGNLWRAHFILLDAEAEPVDVVLNSYFGATVTAIASDHEGGFFAVGYVPSGEGDQDVAVWRVNKDHVPIFTGQPWDYVPQNWQQKHQFTDLAFDVVVDGDVAWIAGMSQGWHNQNPPLFEARGLIVRINIHTFAVLSPVTIAPQAGTFTQSFFNGVALHPEGAFVASQGCDATCSNQRIEVALYSDQGTRLWHMTDGSGQVAYGSDVAPNKHGLVLVAASMRDGQSQRGRMLSRVVYDDEVSLDAWFPANKDSSAASAVAVGAHDEAFYGGYVTLGGVQRAYAVRLHQ